jgi:hypothetical protein
METNAPGFKRVDCREAGVDLQNVIDVVGGQVPRKIAHTHLAALGVVAAPLPLLRRSSESACGAWLRATGETIQSASCTLQGAIVAKRGPLILIGGHQGYAAIFALEFFFGHAIDEPSNIAGAECSIAR